MWEEITQDSFVLQAVRGYKLDFHERPTQAKEPPGVVPDNKIDITVDKLLRSGAIGSCTYEEDKFLSSFFLVQKPDSSHRFILNLKNLNFFIKKEHFKLEDLRTALNLLDKKDYMCRLDLKDAYLLIPISKEDRKYLRFRYRDQMFQFNSLPFGLSSAPFVFTKVAKPIANWLRNKGIRVTVYLGDFLILGASEEECAEGVRLAIYLLEALGFIINWKKSDLNPRRVCRFLGMIINSEEMTIELPSEKRIKIRNMLDKLLRKQEIKIQTLEECIGTLVAACPAIAYGWLYYKELEKLKTSALIINNYDQNRFAMLSSGAVEDLNWWRSHIMKDKNIIRSNNFDLEIFSDASGTGWRATCGEKKAKGLWNLTERRDQINLLELKAAFLALKSFASGSRHKQILLRIDNVTALAYINKMGGTKFNSLNKIAKQIWEWCIPRNLWLFAEYVASKENPADEGSRLSNLDTEWELAGYAFRRITAGLGVPILDLFASRINFKCKKYCSWERDADAIAINAFTISWRDDFWYAFPPFSLINRILKKIKEEGSTGILVVPLWTAQPWFPVFKQLLISDLITLSASYDLLLSPCRSIVHPLAECLTLVCGVVSGKRSRKRGWKNRQ